LLLLLLPPQAATVAPSVAAICTAKVKSKDKASMLAFTEFSWLLWAFLCASLALLQAFLAASFFACSF